MGLIGRVLSAGRVGEAVGGVAEVFVGNRAAREAAEHAAFLASLGQFGAEFAVPRTGWFDRFVEGLNRLPRPMLALGTLGLFVYAMAEPAGFATRMQGLAYIPEPLWWLLGAVVSFYFGARELHHFRGRPPITLTTPPPTPIASRASTTSPAAPANRAADPTWNAAVEEWRARG